MSDITESLSSSLYTVDEDLLTSSLAKYGVLVFFVLFKALHSREIIKLIQLTRVHLNTFQPTLPLFCSSAPVHLKTESANRRLSKTPAASAAAAAAAACPEPLNDPSLTCTRRSKVDGEADSPFILQTGGVSLHFPCGASPLQRCERDDLQTKAPPPPPHRLTASLPRLVRSRRCRTLFCLNEMTETWLCDAVSRGERPHIITGDISR